jgi:hypothetical protein
MSKMGQLALLQTKDHWRQYKDEIGVELAKQNKNSTAMFEFPKEPTKYPCLVASIMPPGDPTLAGAVIFPQVLCCFVYPDDARHLLTTADKVKTDCQPVVELVADDDDDEQPEPKKTAVKYKPSQVGTLILAMALEMNAIGALKKDNLIKSVLRVEKWLDANSDENAKSDLVVILERLWKDQNAG